MQVTEVARFLGEDRSLGHSLHDAGVIFTEKEPLKIVRHDRKKSKIASE